MYIAAADGSSVTDLSAAGDGWQVDWSPDGQLILLASHRDRDDRITDVYSMRPDGSDIKRLTNGVGQTPAWSPDGTHIVFSAPGLSIMNADGAGIVRLPTPGIGEATLPDWTP
jgi:Tol biopolymer transport system component